MLLIKKLFKSSKTQLLLTKHLKLCYVNCFFKHLFHQLFLSSHVVVPHSSLLLTPGPHPMLLENNSFSLIVQRKLWEALSLRQHVIVLSYMCDRWRVNLEQILSWKTKNAICWKTRASKFWCHYHHITYVLWFNIEWGPGEWKLLIFPKGTACCVLKILTITLDGVRGK